MKKVFILLVSLLLLAGCTKVDDLPKLKSKDVAINYGDKIEYNFETFLDLSNFSSKEIEELEANGEIDTSKISFDEGGNARVGVYEVKISYYTDVVRSTFKVISTDPTPTIEPLEEIVIEVGDIYFDFAPYFRIISPIDSPLEITYNDGFINYYAPGEYPLYINVTDQNGNTNERVVSVNVQ